MKLIVQVTFTGKPIESANGRVEFVREKVVMDERLGEVVSTKLLRHPDFKEIKDRFKEITELRIQSIEVIWPS